MSDLKQPFTLPEYEAARTPDNTQFPTPDGSPEQFLALMAIAAKHPSGEYLGTEAYEAAFAEYYGITCKEWRDQVHARRQEALSYAEMARWSLSQLKAKK